MCVATANSGVEIKKELLVQNKKKKNCNWVKMLFWNLLCRYILAQP